MLQQNNAPPNAILSLFAGAHYVSAVPDDLPALPDHHANPDPGLAAVLHAFLPHRAGNPPAAGADCPTVVPPVVVRYDWLSLVPQRDLLGIQRLLNSTEFNVHQLTALLDCRGLHKVGRNPSEVLFFNRAVLPHGGIKLSTSSVSLCAAHRLTWLD